MPVRAQLGLERGDQLAVLGVDRADAAEQLVVMRHLEQPLARDVAAAGDVLEERHHVVHPLGPAERDDHDRVVRVLRPLRGRAVRGLLALLDRCRHGWHGATVRVD